MKIGKHVYMLELDGPKGTVYPVLIRDGAELLLADTGFPGYFELLEEAVRAEGETLEALTMLVLTHQDIDHIGCINEVRRRAPGAKVYLHADEAPYLDGRSVPLKLRRLAEDPDGLTAEELAFFRTLEAAFASRRTEADVLLRDGDALPLLGGIRVVHTPGHTPGHICLYIAAERLLIAGDATGLGPEGLTGPSPAYTLDMDMAVRSIERARAHDIDRVLCFHGGLYQGKL